MTDSLSGEVAQSASARASAATDVTRTQLAARDLASRLVHALLGLSFALAYFSAESEWWRLVHVTSGYGFAVALGLRVLLGLLGPPGAALGLWWRRAAALRSAVQQAWRGLRGKPGAWALASLGLVHSSALVLMLAVVPVTLTGATVYEGWVDDWFNGAISDVLVWVHEVVAEAMASLILVHLTAVWLRGLALRQPYWRRMVGACAPREKERARRASPS